MSVVAVVWVVRKRRPEHSRAWYWFVSGGVLFLAGHVVLAVYSAVVSELNPFPSPADALYILGYLCLIAGEVSLVRRRSAQIEGDNLIDSLILATCVGVVVWAYVLVPYAKDPQLAMPEKLLSGGYSLLVLASIAVAGRLAVGSGRRNPSYYFLAGALTFVLASDVLATMGTATGTSDSMALVSSAISYVLVATAALHPSMVLLTERPADREIQLTRRRLTMLLAAVLFVPGLLIFDAVSGQGTNVPVLAGGSVLLTVLVLARLAGLVRAKERKARREQVLRKAGSALVTATTTEQIHQGALVALLALIGSGGSTRVSIASGSSETLTVVAADGPAAEPAVGTKVPVEALPTDARDAFLRGRTIVLDRATPLDVPTSVFAEEARVVIVPLSTSRSCSRPSRASSSLASSGSTRPRKRCDTWRSRCHGE